MKETLVTSFWAITAVLIFLVSKTLLKYYITSKEATKNGCKPPPRYPYKDKIFGSDFAKEINNARARGHLHSTIRGQFASNGKTFEESLLLGRVVYNTMSMENIQTMAATKFGDYGVEPSRKLKTPNFTGDGILSTDGAAWKRSRELIMPTFAKREIADLGSLEVYMDRFLSLIPRDNQTVDMQPLLKRLFLDTSTEFLFGESINSLLPTAPAKSQEFLDAFEESLMGMGLRIRAGPISKIKLYFDTTWEKAYRKVHQFVDHHVEQALFETSGDIKTNIPSLTNEDQDEFRTPQKYVLVREMAKEIRDKVTLRYELMSVFFPGRDTIPVLLANTLFLLARHPSIYTTLRRTALSSQEQPITYELLKSLTFFKHVLFESLRLLPPASLVHRTALRNTILPNGGGIDGQSPIFVRKGEMVAAHLHALHRDRDLWGEDADEFNPDRWEGRRTYWDFVPFYGGARICPAQQMVLVQATYVLLRLVRMFGEIENRDEEVKFIGLTRMVTESRNGVKVAFVKNLVK